jgi:hypothetical protein
LLLVLAVLAGLACAGIIGLQWTVCRARGEVGGLLAALAEQGLYVEPARAEGAVPATKPKPPAAANAGPEIAREEISFESFALQVEAPADISDFTDKFRLALAPWETMSEAMHAALRKYLADNQETLRNLHNNGAKGAAEISWIFTSETAPRPWKVYGSLVKGLRLLEIESLIALIDGDTDTAATALRAGLVLICQSRRNPYVSDFLTHREFCTSMSYSLQNALATGMLEPDQLAALQNALGPASTKDQLRQELRKEFECGLMLFQNPRFWAAQLPSNPLERLLPGSNSLLISASALSGMLDIQRQTYLREFSQLAGLMDIPPPERYQQFRVHMESHTKGWRVFRGMFADPLFGALTAFLDEAQVRAQLEIIGAALAIERHRVDHDSLPETLEVLSPVYLGSPPRDPFDGEPLRYHLTNNGFVLYSVGVDGKDNGGRQEDYDLFYEHWDDESDVIFRVTYRPNTPGVVAQTGASRIPRGEPEKTEIPGQDAPGGR